MSNGVDSSSMPEGVLLFSSSTMIASLTSDRSGSGTRDVCPNELAFRNMKKSLGDWKYLVTVIEFSLIFSKPASVKSTSSSFLVAHMPVLLWLISCIISGYFSRTLSTIRLTENVLTPALEVIPTWPPGFSTRYASFRADLLSSIQ